MSIEIDEVAGRVFRVQGASANWYMVVEAGEICLIDTGYPGEHDRVLAAIDRIGRSPRDVVAVLITHAHPDHLGSAERLRREHGALVHTHVDEAALVRGERQEAVSASVLVSHLWRRDVRQLARTAVRAQAASLEHVPVPITFGGGVPLAVPGRPVPIPTPGHTSGHASFHLPDRGVLITGDALVTRDPWTGAVGPRVPHAALNHDHQRAVHSLELLRGLDVEVVCPGHGDPLWGKVDEAVDEAATAEV